jgi:UDP-glucose 4-epimerase
MWPSGVERVVVDDVASSPINFKAIDTVVHLGTANEVVCNRDIQAAFQSNAVGTYRLLERCLADGVRNFIYFSTVHVYRTPLVGRFPESVAPLPTQPYAIAHRTGEDLTRAATERGLNAIVVRLSNAVGAPAAMSSRWSLVANDLCRQAIREKTLTLKSNGLQWRNFISLGDVCNAVLHLVESGAAHRQPAFELYNLAGTETVQVIDLARLVADRCQIMFGYRPAIKRPDGESTGASGVLEIPVEKLVASGFKYQVPIHEEIDGILRYCAQDLAQS